MIMLCDFNTTDQKISSQCVFASSLLPLALLLMLQQQQQTASSEQLQCCHHQHTNSPVCRWRQPVSPFELSVYEWIGSSSSSNSIETTSFLQARVVVVVLYIREHLIKPNNNAESPNRRREWERKNKTALGLCTTVTSANNNNYEIIYTWALGER